MTTTYRSTPAFERRNPVAPENFIIPQLPWEEMPNPKHACCICNSEGQMDQVRDHLTQAQIPILNLDGLTLVVQKDVLERKFPSLFEGRSL
jgi:hypothetical protein